MNVSVKNTVTNSITTHSSMKLAKQFIGQEVIFMNEEESDKTKEERHYYTESDFKIS